MKRERQWGKAHTESQGPSANYPGVEGLTRRLLDIGDVARYTGLSTHTLYTMVSQRRIPFVKMGRLTKFDLRAIDEWIAKHSVSPMKPLLYS
jgi:excisionase family DNA binding protein